MKLTIWLMSTTHANNDLDKIIKQMVFLSAKKVMFASNYCELTKNKSNFISFLYELLDYISGSGGHHRLSVLFPWGLLLNPSWFSVLR